MNVDELGPVDLSEQKGTVMIKQDEMITNSRRVIWSFRRNRT